MYLYLYIYYNLRNIIYDLISLWEWKIKDSDVLTLQKINIIIIYRNIFRYFFYPFSIFFEFISANYHLLENL